MKLIFAENDNFQGKKVRFFFHNNGSRPILDGFAIKSQSILTVNYRPNKLGLNQFLNTVGRHIALLKLSY